MIKWEETQEIPREYDKWFDEAYEYSISYLKDTDWQVIAGIERQRQIPEDVWRKRQEALDVVTSA